MNGFSDSSIVLDLSSIHSTLTGALNKEALDGPIVFGDTETTGLLCSRDRVIEIGALRFEANGELSGVFHQYYDPQMPIPDESAKVHGITDAVMRDMLLDGRAKKMTYQEYEKFQKFIDGATFIAHNARFDQEFLEAEGARFGLKFAPKHVIDTIPLGRLRFPRRKLSLDMLCKHLGISSEARAEFHGALVDADLLSRMFCGLIKAEQNNLFDGLIAAPVLDQVAEAPQGSSRARLLGQPTMAELARHDEFIRSKIKRG